MPLQITGQYRYPPPNAAWLGTHAEPILRPDIPIIDAHHHLWEEPGNTYLTQELLDDLAGGHRIVGTVFVQCHYGYRHGGADHLKPVGETECVESARKAIETVRPEIRACAGIVGFADLLCPALLDEVLDAHRAAAPRSFCGVRQSVARSRYFPQGIIVKPAPAGMLSDPRVATSLRRLALRDLCFDAMLYHEQIPELTTLAGRIDTRLVLDHVGCPLGIGPFEGNESATFADWRRDIERLAKCDNVYVKFGGFGMIVTGARFHLQPGPPTSEHLAQRWRPYFEVCVNAFGTERCMFESNFPVDKAMYSYAVLWNAFKRLAGHASAAETANLFEHTARRAYRLDL